MYTEARPVGYFLIKKVSSPGASDGEIGVYGRITGLPFLSTSASGFDDLTTTHDAIGRRDASLSGSSKMNLDRRVDLMTLISSRADEGLTWRYCGYTE